MKREVARAFCSAARSSAPGYVVFGGTGGVGEELCRTLLGSGSRLLIAGRNEEKLERLRAEFPAALVHKADATDAKQVEKCLSAAVQEFGRVDGVANCAGSVLLKSAHNTSDTEFDAVLSTNLLTAFQVVKASAKVMSRQKPKGGSVVLCSSAVARIGLPNHEAIAAAKAGVEGLALSAAATYARYNVRINCVAPGLTRTPMTQRITSNETALKASLNMHALQRIGEPQEVAKAMAFLLDPSNSFITAQVLGVDGGLGSLR